MRILLEVQIPDDLGMEFMQVLRDFDMKHDPNHEDKVQVRMLMHSEQTMDEVNAMFDRITPVPQFRQILRLDDNEPV